MLTEETLERIRTADMEPASVAVALGLSKGMIRSGGSVRVCCPWHTEKSPACAIRNKRGIRAHCFACQGGGSLIDLVMAARGLDFVAAALEAAEIAGVEVVEEGSEPQARGPRPARKRRTMLEELDSVPYDRIPAELATRIEAAFHEAHPLRHAWKYNGPSMPTMPLLSEPNGDLAVRYLAGELMTSERVDVALDTLRRGQARLISLHEGRNQGAAEDGAFWDGIAAKVAAKEQTCWSDAEKRSH